MNHQIRTSLEADQFNDPVTGFPGRDEAKVLFVKTDGFLNVLRVQIM
jgi:hypothetical protein